MRSWRLGAKNFVEVVLLNILSVRIYKENSKGDLEVPGHWFTHYCEDTKAKIDFWFSSPRRSLCKGYFQNSKPAVPACFSILISGERGETEGTYYRSEMVWFGNSDVRVIQL